MIEGSLGTVSGSRLPSAAWNRYILGLTGLCMVLADVPMAQAQELGTSGGSTLLAQATPAAPFRAPDVRVPVTPPSSTILPTDVMPLPSIQNRLTFAENLQLRILQKLPARFYFTSSVETSWRYETNVFQFPKKRVFLQKLPQPAIMRQLPLDQQQQIINLLKLVSSEDKVFRVLPNVTGGFTLTPHTRLFGNFFMIRDSLCKNIRLNTNIYSYAYGLQQDIPLGRRGNLQAEIQFRELNQMHQHSIFDFLPALTASFVLTPRTVCFVNTLLQIRGRKYFQAPTRELDPFYTWGMLYQRNGWSFSASSTFVQNFREPFKHQATIPVNNYAMISDFEIARRIVRQVPGLQAFVRAEPIWNMHAHNRAGLSGMDFRLFGGLRFSMTKPSLTAGLEQLKQQIEEQETEPPKPTPKTKPSAFLMPYEITAQAAQPIHGPLSDDMTPISSTYPMVNGNGEVVSTLPAEKPVETAVKTDEKTPAVVADAPIVQEPETQMVVYSQQQPAELAATPPAGQAKRNVVFMGM